MLNITPLQHDGTGCTVPPEEVPSPQSTDALKSPAGAKGFGSRKVPTTPVNTSPGNIGTGRPCWLVNAASITVITDVPLLPLPSEPMNVVVTTLSPSS